MLCLLPFRLKPDLWRRYRQMIRLINALKNAIWKMLNPLKNFTETCIRENKIVEISMFLFPIDKSFATLNYNLNQYEKNFISMFSPFIGANDQCTDYAYFSK